MPSIEQFRTGFSIAEPVLADLRRRLSETRWPASPAGDPWAYGTSLEYLRSVVDHWRNDFDWRARERLLNHHRHYLLPVRGRDVHVVVVEGGNGQRPPVLMGHGWPGAFTEFLQVADRLAHPGRHGGSGEDAVTAVLVSLPGCGLSSAPAKPIGPRDIAADWLCIMREHLGHERFLVHGSDWGAAIASWLAADQPDAVVGLHLTSAIIQPDIAAPGIELEEEERAFLQRRAARGPWESGYQAIQGSKPLTLAYGLTDSPAGLAAWILEKYQSWGAARGTAAPPPVPLDELLTILSLYWFAGPGPSTWIYRFLLDGTGLRFPAGLRVRVPTAICSFRHDVSPPSPAVWQQRCYEVVRRTAVDHGGHFPGLDAGSALATDLAAFIRQLLD
ncbi:MAG: epoxide hydrolase family protein [Steroidobacteraceae bacterium]